MGQRKLFTGFAAMVVGPVVGPVVGLAAATAFATTTAIPAAAATETRLPLSATFRHCDFSEARNVAAIGTGSGEALIKATANTVSADLQFAIGDPNTAYTVRLIQSPRPSDAPCEAGSPGTAVATLHTDANGTGSVTVEDVRQPGATGAWVYVNGPPEPGRVKGEFYTSNYIAGLD